jgi:hypothetical protein
LPRGIYRDAVRSSQRPCVKTSGLRGVSRLLLATILWKLIKAPRRWLPDQALVMDAASFELLDNHVAAARFKRVGGGHRLFLTLYPYYIPPYVVSSWI